MQTQLESILTKKYLFAAVLGIALFNIGINLASKDLAILAGNLTYIPVAGSLLVISILISIRFGLNGTHGLAWFSFCGYAISWFIAEMLWIYQELYMKEDPFPSSADIFYIVGYPFLLMFFVTYLQPVRSAITRRIFIIPILVSVGVLIPSLYFVLGSSTNNDALEVTLGAIYPVFDAVIIIPAMIGVVLFFKGQVNFMWTLMCLGTVCVFVADTAFLFGENTDSYYTGNPMEILFYWNYILLVFGVKSHLDIFKREKHDKRDLNH